MKALTLYQPWASLIALGEKKIETRSWPTMYRGELAIHAGKTNFTQFGEVEPFRTVLEKHGLHYRTLPTGVIIATCVLVDCQEVAYPIGYPYRDKAFLKNGKCVEGNEYAFGDYAPGRYAWILADIKPLDKTIPARGKQGLWNWEDSL